MKIKNTMDNTVRFLEFKVKDGPELPAGPIYQDDITFIVDKIEWRWSPDAPFSGVKVSGYRKRDGYVNRTYRHLVIYFDWSEFPDYIRELVDKYGLTPAMLKRPTN